MKPVILNIICIREVDVDPDTSYIGEYTDTPTPWAICRHCGEYLTECGQEHAIPDRGRECRFFIPYAGGETAGTPDYIEYGKQNYARMESLNNQEWCFLILSCAACVLIGNTTQTIRGGAINGIESDSDASFLEETEEENLNELRQHLIALGIGKRAIDAAMKKVEKKERE